MKSPAILITVLGLAAVVVASAQAPPARRVRFNGRLLAPDQMVRLEQIERVSGVRLPDGDFWYDNRSGAAGFWNGPAAAALPPGLELGGSMPPNCSGGNTGVFVNGRVMHPPDFASLMQLGPG